MDLENIFRYNFNVEEGVDVINLMEAAITVVASKYPDELKLRSSRILEFLDFKLDGSAAIKQAKDDDDSKSPAMQNQVCKKEAKLPNGISVILGKNQEDEKHKKTYESYELKMEATRRKLQQNYSQIEREKRKRKIQVLDVKCLPKAVSSKMRCVGSSRCKRIQC